MADSNAPGSKRVICQPKTLTSGELSKFGTLHLQALEIVQIQTTQFMEVACILLIHEIYLLSIIQNGSVTKISSLKYFSKIIFDQPITALRRPYFVPAFSVIRLINIYLNLLRKSLHSSTASFADEVSRNGKGTLLIRK